MEDRREALLRDMTSILVADGMNPEDIARARNALTVAVSNYDISEKSTALITVDTADENILQLYAGTMLTEGKSKKTVDGYIALLKRFRDAVGKTFRDVNAFDVRIWIAEMQRHVSARTCENYRAYLSAFFKWMSVEDFTQANIMDKIKPIRYTEEVLHPFSDTEVDALRSACKTLRDRAMIEVLLSSGIRVSELCALDRGDIDLDTLTVTVRHGKGGKQRKTYITEVCKVHLIRYLDSREDDNPAVFVTRYGKRHTKNSTENDLHRIGTAAGVDNVHPHRCRRTFATNMYKRGMDIHTIQRLMGHSDINTTMCYITSNDIKINNEYRRFA